MPDLSEASGSFESRYLAGAFAPFFELPPGDLEAGLARPGIADSDGLADALAEQAVAREDHPAQRAAIERLRHPSARVIVTGQQPGVLLGPLYTLSKAVTALQLARRLDREDRPVIAVFWVASQDHDVDEIRSANLLGPEGEFRSVRLPFPEGMPSGRSPWDHAWTRDVDAALRDLYGDTVAADETRALARRASAPGGSIADVFARLLSLLLGGEGLVVLDPTYPAMARRFRAILDQEVAEPAAGPAAIRDAGERLKRLGERPQLGRASDATNLFLQTTGETRVLLRWDGHRFHLDGQARQTFERRDLATLLDDDPASITPAAGLRPITQDAALPTAAVVVGPGELKYFAQLRGVYEHHGVGMPVIWPRATVTLLEPPVVRILARHELDVAAFEADPDGALEARLLALHGHGVTFHDTLVSLDDHVKRMLAEISAIDPTLQRTVARSHEVLGRTVDRLRGKTAAALALRDTVTTQQFARLRGMLLPMGGLQERTISPFAYFAKFGIDAVMRRMRSIGDQGRHDLPIDEPSGPPRPRS